MKSTEILQINLAAITSFLVAFLTLPVLIKYSLRKNFVVVPSRRRLHKKITPSLGGVAIFVGFLVALIFWVDLSGWLNVRYLIASLFIIFLLGIRDDLVPFIAWKKMLGQAAAILVMLFSDVKINSLYGLFGIYEIPIWLGLILTSGFIIIVTNAYNLIDGVDGLAGTVGIISMGTFGIWFQFTGQHIFSLLCFSMVGGILAFLIFNWEPAEVFMGDTGAMVGGMLLSILTIQFMNSNQALPIDHVAKFTSSIGAAVCIIILPLCDTIRIIILRISRGQSPVKPDKNHIHHGLIRLGFSHAKSTMILGGLSLAFVALAWIFRGYGNSYIILTVVLSCIALSVTLDRLLVRKVSGS